MTEIINKDKSIESDPQNNKDYQFEIINNST